MTKRRHRTNTNNADEVKFYLPGSPRPSREPGRTEQALKALFSSLHSEFRTYTQGNTVSKK